VLAETLRATVPPGLEEAELVVLSDGPDAAARFEHQRVAAEIGVTLATPEELERSGGGIVIRDEAGKAAPVGAVYRRTDEDRATAADGSTTAVWELLGPAIGEGRVGCVNSFGTGLADDKLLHAYVEEMIDFYLGEPPLLRSVRTYDLGEPVQRRTALDRLDHLVVKPRSGLGGSGVVILARTSTAQSRRVQTQLAREPGRLVAQEMVRISRHPTATEEGLRPRHVDLRPYAFTIGDRIEVASMPFTRYARQSDSMIVNSSQGGGGKDTWVLE
jgi:uncharacterized circularly permuted ATP-grasp superfamily protein